MNKKGLSLIEIVLVIVILGIAMLPLLITYANVITRGMNREAISVAGSLAEELMEEIESKNYDNNPESPWTQKQNLGPDGTETRETFNDVDDFEGWSENPIPGFSGYSSSVEVYYVKPKNLDDINPEPPIGPTEYTDFKKIIVTVTHSQAGEIKLVSVRQGY